MQSEDGGDEPFRRLVSTFSPEMRPDIMVLTGGEPLLRPRLVRDLAIRARQNGTRVVVASGLFFARDTRTPNVIAEALGEIDHLTASLDFYHEQEVPRESAFRVLHEALDRGISVSIHVTGLSDSDPYLADITQAIRRAFDERVPILPATVSAIGRAKDWVDVNRLARSTAPKHDIDPLPCDLASWPVIRHDGIAFACCSQDALDRSPPAHLRLGDAAIDDWATLRRRIIESPMLRGIRSFGPEYLANRYGNGQVPCDGLCSTCLRLSDHPEIAEQAAIPMSRPVIGELEKQIAQKQRENFLARHGPPSYRHLSQLGHIPSRIEPCQTSTEKVPVKN
jgi:hypothetical protein